MKKNNEIPELLNCVIKHKPTANGLEELILKICSQTGITKELATSIVEEYFYQIQLRMLKGQRIILHYFGTFFISRPQTGNKQKIKPRFKIANKLKKILNDR